MMQNEIDLEEKMIELETKVAFQEDMLIKLHDALYEQQRELFKMSEKLSMVEADQKQGKGDFNRLYMNEKPPHY